MSRHDEGMGVAPNPSQYYLEWNSEKCAFCYYDKEAAERVPFPLPLRFIALKFMNCITGYDDSIRDGIYSNEVYNSTTELLRVTYRNPDNGLIAAGIYKDIKETIRASGGHFTKSIYAMSAKGVIINIRLRGQQIIEFGSIEKYGPRWQDEWIVVKDFATRDYNGRAYTVPVFSFGGTVNHLDNDRASSAYSIVKNYFDSRRAPALTQPAAISAPATAPQAAFGPMDDDDLPF